MESESNLGPVIPECDTPNCAHRLSPHENTSPSSVTAIMCDLPHATCVNLVPSIKPVPSTSRGVRTGEKESNSTAGPDNV